MAAPVLSQHRPTEAEVEIKRLMSELKTAKEEAQDVRRRTAQEVRVSWNLSFIVFPSMSLRLLRLSLALLARGGCACHLGFSLFITGSHFSFPDVCALSWLFPPPMPPNLGLAELGVWVHIAPHQFSASVTARPELLASPRSLRWRMGHSCHTHVARHAPLLDVAQNLYALCPCALTTAPGGSRA